MVNKCNICGMIKNDVITGIDVTICKSCAETLNELFNETNTTVEGENKVILNPKLIKTELDKFVISQDEVKELLSVEICNHYKRIQNNLKSKKNNILLIGKTGSGKTYILEKIAEIINVPFLIVNSTEYTETGYVGKSVEDIIQTLMDKFEDNVSKVEQAIIYIDEIDKLKSNSKNLEKDMGEGVQKSLLKLIEGTELIINGIPINTKKMLFIFGGAFEGVSNVYDETSSKRKIGFITEVEKNPTKTKTSNEINLENLINYGFMREFVGRVSIIVKLDELTEDDLFKILTNKYESIILEYIELFKLDDIELTFDEEVLRYIAKQGYLNKTGARSLRYILAKKMNKLIYKITDENSSNINISMKVFMEL